MTNASERIEKSRRKIVTIVSTADSINAVPVDCYIPPMHKETHEELEFANDFMKDRGSTFSGTSGLAANDDDEDAAKVVSCIEISSSLFESTLPLNTQKILT
jgi:hypothetical protein